MFQGGGAVATLSSAVAGGFMEATVTLPTSNNNWQVTIDAEVSGTVGNGLADYSVRVA